MTGTGVVHHTSANTHSAGACVWFSWIHPQILDQQGGEWARCYVLFQVTW